MQPQIEKTSFGSITIAGETYEHDIMIRLGGAVEKRKKRLSKDLYGTSHIISLAEAEHVYEDGAAELIVGTGQFGRAGLSDEAAEFLKQMCCAVKLLPTKKAIATWNQATGDVIGLFHITC